MNDRTRMLESVAARRRFPAPFAHVAGFTVIEMLVVVSIVGILATTAAPSFAPMIASKRAETTATDIYVALVQSRSEATKRNASATLAHKAAGWGTGWQLTVIDPTDSTKTLTLDDHSVKNGVTVTGPDNVVYQSSGRVQGATNPSFAVTGTSGSSTERRWVCIDLSGRPLMKTSACP
jgi:prepilin-type N-terminal cleavage/methylation domain-containing protein